MNMKRRPCTCGGVGFYPSASVCRTHAWQGAHGDCERTATHTCSHDGHGTDRLAPHQPIIRGIVRAGNSARLRGQLFEPKLCINACTDSDSGRHTHRERKEREKATGHIPKKGHDRHHRQTHTAAPYSVKGHDGHHRQTHTAAPYSAPCSVHSRHHHCQRLN